MVPHLLGIRRRSGSSSTISTRTADAADPPLHDRLRSVNGTLPNPLATVPGFEAMRAQQEAFMKAFMGGLPGWSGSGPAAEAAAEPANKEDELAQIKRQLADLQKKLSKL